MGAPTRKQMPQLFAAPIGPGSRQSCCSLLNGVLIHLEQPTIGTEAPSGMRSRFSSRSTLFASVS